MNNSDQSAVINSLRLAGSPSELAVATTQAIAQDPNIALARIWLVGPGDHCDSCRFQLVCPDKTRCLHLVASAGVTSHGRPSPDGAQSRHQRVPIGVRKVGLVARTRRPLIAASLKGTEAWITDAGWIAAEGVRSFAGSPIQDQGHVRGVIAVFDRRELDERLQAERARQADDLGVALGVASRLASLANDRHQLLQELSLGTGVATGPDLAPLVGSSSAFRRILAQIDLACASRTPVLVVGVSGSGRTATARAIHARGSRSGRPLLTLDLAAPSGNLDARLFGRPCPVVGGNDSRGGLLSIADGGTLLIEHVERLPRALQPRLAAWLDDHARAANDELAPNIIATSTPDLFSEAASGAFQRELLDRLAIIRIDLPPLSDRVDDVAAIATRMVERIATRIGREPPALVPATVDWLRAYAWPGHLAELHAVLDRAVRICGDTLAPDALEFPRAPASVDQATAAPILTRAQLRQRERQNIRAALAAASGRVSGPGGAAELLGTKPTTLASRIKALGLARATRGRVRVRRP